MESSKKKTFYGMLQENQFLGMECSNKNYFLTMEHSSKLIFIMECPIKMIL